MNLKKRKMKKNFPCKFSFACIDMYSIQISSLIYKVILYFSLFHYCFENSIFESKSYDFLIQSRMY